MNHDEGWLREVLQTRAEQVDAVGDFTAPSIGLARRRTRRAVAATTLALVVAAGGVATVAWPRPLATPAPADSSRPVPTATPSPSLTPTSSPTPTPSATPTPSPTPTPSSTPSRAPAVPTALWALDGVVHVGDRTVTVPGGRVVSDLAQLEGGRLLVRTAARGDSAGGRYLVLDSRGRLVADLGRANVAGAVTDGRTIAIQADWGADVRVVDSKGRKVATRSGAGSPTAVAAGRVLLAGLETSVLWDPRSGKDTAVPAGTLRLSTDGRLAMGSTEADAGGAGVERCWFVVDLTRSATRKTIERCGEGENPESFAGVDRSPDGRYLLGSAYTDGGFFFRLAVVRADDGRVVTGRSTDGDGVNGWSWQFDGTGSSILFSRNVADPAFPAVRNDLVRCTVSLKCTQVGRVVTLADQGNGVTEPRYVVGRPLPR